MLRPSSRTLLQTLLLCLVAIPAHGKPKSGSGKIYVLSTTTGAEILINGKKVATVPRDAPFKVRTGKHKVRVQLRGYSPFEQTVVIKRGSERMIEADLLAHSGIVVVETPGLTATVLVDGKAIGKTPFDGEVTIGEREIGVTAGGFAPFRTRLTVKGGQRYPVNVTLQPDGSAPDEAATEGAWYEQWWVWAGAGAALVAVTVVGLTAGAAAPVENQKTTDARIRLFEPAPP